MRFCEYEPCGRPLTPKPGEAPSTFKKRKTCGRVCGTKNAGLKNRGKGSMFGKPKAKPGAKNAPSPGPALVDLGAPILAQCAGCAWTRAGRCRVKTSPAYQWHFSPCRWKRWSVDHTDVVKEERSL
jgi:hypothetical protein